MFSFQTYGDCDRECRFHSGVPIFHEGMKYWSCCQRKTSDFSAFLAQEGCTTGDHLWVKKKVWCGRVRGVQLWLPCRSATFRCL